MSKVGLILGSGLERLVLGDCEVIGVETRYGRVSLRESLVGETSVYLLARHGEDHSVPPHRINYRANIAALRELGCRQVLATNAVGSLRLKIHPGALVLPDQFIDFTHGRQGTFFDGESGPVRHVDVTHPYCPALRRALQASVSGTDWQLHPAGLYVCTEGPRFETPAEINMFAQWGADVVGMTGVPEVVLAREAGLCYASACLVTNYAAGVTSALVTGEEVNEMAAKMFDRMQDLIHRVLRLVSSDPECSTCNLPWEDDWA
jgi:5'-methylthioadenosine phosphorylase